MNSDHPGVKGLEISQKRLLQVCVVLYVVAFGLRLGIAGSLGFNSPFPTRSDSQTFYDRARDLAAGRGYVQVGHDGVLRPTAYQVPGAPIMMAAGIRLLGDSPRSIRLSAITISSFSAPLMFLFALEVSPAAVAILAALGSAFYPSWAFLSTDGLTEPFFISFLLAGLWLTARAIRQRSPKLEFFAGLVWGAAALVRPLAAPMVAVLVAYLLWRRSVKSAALLAAGCALVLAPWLIRNQVVFGHAILANEGGETFLGSNNPYVVDNPANKGLWIPPWQVPKYRAVLQPMTDEFKENKLEYHIGITFIESHPGIIPKLIFYKLARWLTPITHAQGRIRYLVLCSYGVLLVLLFIGLMRRSFHSSPALHLVILWSLVLCAVTAVYWGNLVRGRLPLELVWIPWGALAAYDLARLTSLARTVPFMQESRGSSAVAGPSR